MENTVQSVRNLAARLNAGEATFADVLCTANKNLVAVSGAPHYENDPEMTEALGDLAEAVIKSFAADGKKVMEEALFEIGRGVATGVYGAEFFDRITAKNRGK